MGENYSMRQNTRTGDLHTSTQYSANIVKIKRTEDEEEYLLYRQKLC